MDYDSGYNDGYQEGKSEGSGCGTIICIIVGIWLFGWIFGLNKYEGLTAEEWADEYYALADCVYYYEEDAQTCL